jgi:hypothetical protein
MANRTRWSIFSTKMSFNFQVSCLEFLVYCTYKHIAIMALIERDLSEPYSVFTYRYFLHTWPELCFMAMDGSKLVGVIICKAEAHRKAFRGYIGMLAVDNSYRNRKIGLHFESLFFFLIVS